LNNFIIQELTIINIEATHMVKLKNATTTEKERFTLPIPMGFKN